jgi:hypothetical protein
LVAILFQPFETGLTGLGPNNKKHQKIFQNSDKIFKTSEYSKYFSNCVPIKNYEEKPAEILSASSTKNLSKKSDFQEKFVNIKFSKFDIKFFKLQILSL